MFRKGWGGKKVRGLLALPLLALCTLGAGRSEGEKASPYFAESFEMVQVVARGYLQQYHEGILVTGPPEYVAQVREALEMIEAADARSWYFVRKHIRKITFTGHPGIDVGAGRFTSGHVGGETGSLAGSVVHDAWHRELYVRGDEWEGRDAESFCLERQNEFLVKTGGRAIDVADALGSEYWKTDYWSRGW